MPADMNVRALLVVVVALAAAPAARAAMSPQGKTFGLGLQLGAPTAVTGKLMVTGDQGIVVGVGAGLGWDVSLSVHADYLWHPSVLVDVAPATFSWYVGGGAWVSFHRAHERGFRYDYYYVDGVPFAVGARIPIGVDMAMNALPFEVYLEGAPTIAVFPRIGFGLGVALGARFWF
jgi:hypothetical protein